MDLSLDLGLEYGESLKQEVQKVSKKYEVVTEESLVPNDGSYLGLDVSESSTGICIYDMGEKLVGNITLETDRSLPHTEVLCRRELKSNLREVIKGKHFKLIIIEDAFQGVNPSTTRLLYAINTAIDEMLLDEEVTCDLFLRVGNKTWKSWLFSIDTGKSTKGLNDKEKIVKCLKMLGVEDSGEGFQDRLDATGMLLGYFLQKDNSNVQDKLNNIKRVQLSDVMFFYGPETYDVYPCLCEYGYKKNDEDNIKVESVYFNRWTKGKILDLLTHNPCTCYMSNGYVALGSLADALGLGYIEGGGYFGFCINNKKVDKYIGNLKKQEGEQ